MSSVQPLKLIAMYLSLSTRQAILFKSSAKKYQRVCTELGGVSSWKVLLLAADYIIATIGILLNRRAGRPALWQRGGGILVDAVFCRSNLNSKEYKAQHEKLG